MDRVPGHGAPSDFPDIGFDMRPETAYLDNYPAWYRISGQISGWVPNIWKNIRLGTVYLGKYLAAYLISEEIS